MNLSAPRTHLVLANRAGFFAATLEDAAKVRASEANASERLRAEVTSAAVKALGAPLVDAARPAPGAALLLTESEARGLAARLTRKRTQNRLAGAGPRRRRRRA